MTARDDRGDPPSPAAVRKALDRALAHRPLNRSPVLSRLLTHVVDHALTRDSSSLKEYALGLEVFDRTEDFDPRLDTIVRVQARRLRQALAAYYEGEGSQEKLRFEMPKGQYGIRFHLLVSSDAPEPYRRRYAQTFDHTRRSRTLPIPRTSLVGREAELGHLEHELSQTRLITITGVGGSGKTRLALELADRARGAFPGGVLFFDLASVADRDVLADMLADAFEVRRTEGRALQQALVDRLQVSIDQPTLLVFDNMEQVLDGADVLGAMLDANAQITALVTSRVHLSLYGESEFPLAPLAVPEHRGRDYEQSALADVPAVRLFLMRAAAANPRANPADDPDSLAELCVRLDGLPLAIELVAAQASSLSSSQMLQRFTGHLDLPSNPARDAPSRQRTLRRVIDSSYDLLSQSARIALRRLSVFAGGFTLEAAEAVADSPGDLAKDLLPAINDLVSMGMLYARSGAGEPRFAMLETLRAYGLERLNAGGEAERIHKAHAAFCVVLAEEGIGDMDHAHRERWLARCDEEEDNFRQAIQYLLLAGPHRWALRLGHVLFMYWERREKILVARRLLNAITDRFPAEADRALWAKVASYAATLASFQGDTAESEGRFSELLELYRELGDRRGEVSSLNALGVCQSVRGDISAARETLVQSLALCRDLGERGAIAAALSNLAECELRIGNSRGVQALLDEAHSCFVAEGDPVSAAWCVNHLGDLARSVGDFERAANLYSDAESAFHRIGDAPGVARSLADRGQLALDRGELADAAALFLESLAGFEALGHQRGMATVVDRLASLASAADQPELVIQLLSVAESWRADIAYSARSDDMLRSQRLYDRHGPELGTARLEALREEGRQMSPMDIASRVQNQVM